MYTPVGNLPPHVIGFVARGRITTIDQNTVLEPTIEWTVQNDRRAKLLYVTGYDFAGYDRGGLYDEAVFGTRHFVDFDRIAFVSDNGPYGRAVEALIGLMPADVRVFPVREIESAKAWLAEPAALAESPAPRRGRWSWREHDYAA